MPATCPTNLIVSNSINLRVGYAYLIKRTKLTLFNSPCIFPHLSVASSHYGPHNLVRPLT